MLTLSYFLVKSFAVRPDDVFIVTYPKAGTTWTQRIAQLIMCRGDVERDSRRVNEAVPWFEVISQDDADSRPSPRVFKSHSIV